MLRELMRSSPRYVMASPFSSAVAEEFLGLSILVSGRESCWRTVGNFGRLDAVECLESEIEIREKITRNERVLLQWEAFKSTHRSSG